MTYNDFTHPTTPSVPSIVAPARTWRVALRSFFALAFGFLRWLYLYRAVRGRPKKKSFGTRHHRRLVATSSRAKANFANCSGVMNRVAILNSQSWPCRIVRQLITGGRQSLRFPARPCLKSNKMRNGKQKGQGQVNNTPPEPDGDGWKEVANCNNGDKDVRAIGFLNGELMYARTIQTAHGSRELKRSITLKESVKIWREMESLINSGEDGEDYQDGNWDPATRGRWLKMVAAAL
jgi:hypothetical protein